MEQAMREKQFIDINQSASLSNYPNTLKKIVTVLDTDTDVWTRTFLKDALTHIFKMVSFTNFFMGNRIRPELEELSPYMMMVEQLIDDPVSTH